MLTTAAEHISELAKNILEDSDFFLVDISVKGANRPKISVYVDGSERNVNLDECAEISNELGFLIDAHEIFDDSYRLNVSSPGLSRPLLDRRQYLKNTGRKVTVTFKREQEENNIEGTLKEVSDDKIIIEKQGERVEFLFDKIKETKVVPSLK